MDGHFLCVKQKTAYEMRISDLESRRVLFRSASAGSKHLACGGNDDYASGVFCFYALKCGKEGIYHAVACKRITGRWVVHGQRDNTLVILEIGRASGRESVCQFG